MSRTHSNDLLFTYESSNIYRSDRTILASPTSWLNDHCIHYWMDCLQSDQIEHQSITQSIQQITDLSLNTERSLSSTCRFLSPETVSILQHEKDTEDLADCAECCDFADPLVKLVVFPINDNRNLTHGGGSHWSLLTWHTDTRTFTHWDSMGKSNESCAQSLANRLTPFIPSNTKQSHKPAFQNYGSINQTNSYDCGVYVLLFSQILSAAVLFETEEQSIDQSTLDKVLRTLVTPSAVSATRKRALQMVDTMAKSQKR